MRSKLHVIICSTRPGRIGPTVANWFYDLAKTHERFDTELVDLAKVNLPLLDEPHHPRLQNYQHAHTKAWSQSVRAADAFVFVTPEYNYAPPPSLLNALDYLYLEWNYKPAAFVSYGGISGGMRSVQMAKQVLTTFKMVPLMEGVLVPMVGEKLDDQGRFRADEQHEKSAQGTLDELARWAEALKVLRALSA